MAAPATTPTKYTKGDEQLTIAVHDCSEYQR